VWQTVSQSPFLILPTLFSFRCFFCSGNNLRDLPHTIVHLTCLKSLRAAKNHIYEIPWELRVLTNLREISFENNPIISPPIEVRSPTRVRRLCASYVALGRKHFASCVCVCVCVRVYALSVLCVYARVGVSVFFCMSCLLFESTFSSSIPLSDHV
jgi:hypothetical protein